MNAETLDLPAGESAHSETALNLDEFGASTPEDWRNAAEPFLKGAPFEKKLVTKTPEGIALQPIYFPGDAEPSNNRPDRFGGLIAQQIAASDPGEFNRQLLANLMAGQNCTPIRLRNSSTDGVSITTLGDLRAALSNVDLAAAPILAWTGASALPFLGLLGALSVEQDVPTKGWSGAILADPLTTAVRDGLDGLSLSNAFDEMAACARWAESCLPEMRTAGIDAAFWADAGASAVDELAFAIATGTEYLREFHKQGIALTAAAERILFELSLGSRVFMDIAKLRAARLLWSRILEAAGSESTPMCLHGRSNAFAKSSLDPHTNLLRATADAFAGIIGGVESVQISAFDEPNGNSGELSRRLARNIPIILSEECGLADVADAAGGSWFIEKLTLEIAEKSWKRFQEIEAAGGMSAALLSGLPQKAAAATADARLAAMGGNRETLVGVNLSANPAEKPVERSTKNASRTDDGDPVRRDAAHISDIPSAIEAFLAGWTIKQVCRALPRTAAPCAIERVSPRRLAGGFEALRAEAWKWTADFGHAPSAWLATFGPPRQHRARADFSSAFLACAGFDVRSGQSSASVEDAVGKVGDTDVVVICSTDDTYPDIVPAFASALKKARPSVQLLLAGAPGENEAAWRAAGVDGFIHLRVSRLEFLGNLLSTLRAKHS